MCATCAKGHECATAVRIMLMPNPGPWKVAVMPTYPLLYLSHSVHCCAPAHVNHMGMLCPRACCFVRLKSLRCCRCHCHPIISHNPRQLLVTCLVLRRASCRKTRLQGNVALWLAAWRASCGVLAIIWMVSHLTNFRLLIVYSFLTPKRCVNDSVKHKAT
jgi:hypothetical protein